MKIIRNREAVIVFLFKASESDLHWNVNEDDSFLWDHFPFLLAMGLDRTLCFPHRAGFSWSSPPLL